MKRTSKILPLAFPFALGAAACWAWVSLLGLFALHAWFPLFQQYWPSLGGGDASQSYRIACAFSSAYSAVIAIVFTLAICRLSVLRSSNAWFAYAVGFLLSLAGPLMIEPMEGLVQFVLLSPDTWSFLAASAVSHWFFTKGAQRAVSAEH